MTVKKKSSPAKKAAPKPATKQPAKYGNKQSCNVVDQAQKLKDVMARITSVGNC